MKIGSIDLTDEVCIVAEIGNNHEGDVQRAHQLIEAAAASGVNAVKFQTFQTKHYVSAQDARRFERLSAFELTPNQFQQLAEYAHSVNLLFISTPFDLGSVDVLLPLVDAYKISSGDNNFYPLIERVSRTKKPLMVSTGLADDAQISETLECIREWRALNQVALLHCVTAYPVDPASANLAAIAALAINEEITVGYSDHTLGCEAAVLSVAAGARIIEKHFTLDKNYSDFHDHHISADAQDMAELVTRVRHAEQLLGAGTNTVQPIEEKIRASVRRSIVAGRDLRQGHVLKFSDLTWIRREGELVPGQENIVVGKRLKRNIDFGEPLTARDVGS